MHGAPEMTIAELQAEIAKKEALKQSPHNEVMYLHQKFAFPAACLVFGLLALSLGVSNSKDSKHASFVVGLAVVFVFYALMMIGSSLTKAHVFPAEPGALAARTSCSAWPASALLIYRHRHADAGVQISLPSPAAIRDAIERRLPWRRRASPAVEASAAAAREARARPSGQAPAPGEGAASEGQPAGESGLGPSRPAGRRRMVRLPRPTLLDAYVGKAYLRVLLLAFAGMLGIFYIGVVHRLVRQSLQGPGDGVPAGAVPCGTRRRSSSTTCCRCRPWSATLVTIGLLTKSSELIVMRACGVSLYRTALPLLVLGLLWSGALFGLEESLLAASNRKAAELKHLMRGGRRGPSTCWRASGSPAATAGSTTTPISIRGRRR